jgi:Tol biopolymer transport system component
MSALDRISRLLLGLLCFPGLLVTTARTAEKPGLLAIAVRRWEGEYRSRDVPGGVETTEVEGEIDTVLSDGSSLRRVVGPGQDCNAPAFSPDGRWLYFQTRSERGYRVERCRPDGSGREAIISSDSLGPPWKDVYGINVGRDGRLMFTVHDGQIGHVGIAGPDGAAPRVLALQSGYLYMAALSPRGDSVACSGPAAGYRLQRIRLSDESTAVLTPDHPESFVPQFTPDGRTIIFLRRDGDLYRVDADGRNLTRLTTGNHHVEFRLSNSDRHGSTDAPHISPNGRRIAYIAEHEGVPNVHIMDLDGSHSRPLTNRKTPCGRVRWSPDGSHLAFISFEGKYPQLFIVSAEGGGPRQITHLDGAVYFLAWQPTGL